MFISILLLPIPQTGFAILNHFCGPQKTIEYSHRLANEILKFIPTSTHQFRPENMEIEMKIVRHLTFRPWIACLETACAFEQWLAFHGKPAQILIGKRVINGQIQMHAWLETESISFFKAPGFQMCFL